MGKINKPALYLAGGLAALTALLTGYQYAGTRTKASVRESSAQEISTTHVAEKIDAHRREYQRRKKGRPVGYQNIPVSILPDSVREYLDVNNLRVGAAYKIDVNADGVDEIQANVTPCPRDGCIFTLFRAMGNGTYRPIAHFPGRLTIGERMSQGFPELFSEQPIRLSTIRGTSLSAFTFDGMQYRENGPTIVSPDDVSQTLVEINKPTNTPQQKISACTSLQKEAGTTAFLEAALRLYADPSDPLATNQKLQELMGNMSPTSGIPELQAQLAANITQKFVFSSPLALGAYTAGTAIKYATQEQREVKYWESRAMTDPIVSEITTKTGARPLSEAHVEDVRRTNAVYETREPLPSPDATLVKRVVTPSATGTQVREHHYMGAPAQVQQERNKSYQSDVNRANAERVRAMQETAGRAVQDAGNAIGNALKGLGQQPQNRRR